MIDIQIAIFDKLHQRLQSSLEAYLTMTTQFGRVVGGVTKEEQDKLLGLEGLERLCKTYGSADYIEKALRDWSDDVVRSLCPHRREISVPKRLTHVTSFSLTFGRNYKIVRAKPTTSAL